jgi:hypothetical protein
MLKNPTGVKEILLRQNSRPFLAKFLLIRYQIAGYCQRALVDKSGMIITQMGTHNNHKW